MARAYGMVNLINLYVTATKRSYKLPGGLHICLCDMNKKSECKNSVKDVDKISLLHNLPPSREEK